MTRRQMSVSPDISLRFVPVNKPSGLGKKVTLTQRNKESKQEGFFKS